MARQFHAGFFAFYFALVLALPAVAAPTAEQRQEILAISTLMTKAGNLFKAGKYKESGEAVKDAQARIEKLTAGADKATVEQLSPVHQRLSKAHALLELEGVTLPALKALEVPADKPATAAKPAAAKSGAPAPTPGAPVPAGAVSFTKQVVPILTARCGGCHVRRMSGEFSMATYDSLMKGSKAGVVIFKGKDTDSVLIEKIVDKQMPPNGNGIPAEELATLKKWILEGATFDGTDSTVNIGTLASASQPAAGPALTVAAATGKETISFARDIAPVLSKSCTGCHGAMRPQENFSLLTFDGLLKGGDGGQVIVPGKPADSLIVKKIKGTAADGQRMPLRQPPLPDDVIAKIEKWIEEGAKFDGPSSKQSIIEVAAIAKANASTHEELSADRARLAEANWRLAMASVEFNRTETANFLTIGNVGENTLAEIGQQAEALAPKVAEIFKAPPDQPLIKGRMTLFVFKERYDYGEFGMMVEKRQLPSAWRGHYKYSIVDAYGAVVPPRAGDYSLPALIGQQLAAGYVASNGKNVPTWFAEGTGRVVASRLVPSDSRVIHWDTELARVLASMSKPDDFITGQLPAEDGDIASYSFVKFLMAQPKQHQKLIDDLRKGGDFGKAFTDAYGGSPSQLAELWVRKPPKATSGKKLGKK